MRTGSKRLACPISRRRRKRRPWLKLWAKVDVATKRDLKELELKITGELTLIKWMLGILLGGVIALIMKAFVPARSTKNDSSAEARSIACDRRKIGVTANDALRGSAHSTGSLLMRKGYGRERRGDLRSVVVHRVVAEAISRHGILRS